MIHRRFLVLLILLGLMLVVHPVAMQNGFAHTLLRVLTACVFAAAIWSVFRSRRSRVVAVLLGVPLVITRWMTLSDPTVAGTWIPFVFNLLASAFLSYAVAMIVYAVYCESHLSREAIYGALCGFLLIGAACGHLFYCAEWFAPDDFQGDGTIAKETVDERQKEALFMYLSYSALTGLSDAQLSPRTDAGRSLVLAEAVIGQFYVIVVLSELISLRVSRVVPPESILAPVAAGPDPPQRMD